MSYYFSKNVDYSFDDAIDKITAELKEEGFGILTEIDVKATLKNKIDVEFRQYKILGACNPPFAHKALQAESQIGIMLPCNVVVQENAEGNGVDVSVMNPMEAMSIVQNETMGEIAQEVTGRLKNALERV
jgi:uncharacterized protein (DUF302 family)